MALNKILLSVIVTFCAAAAGADGLRVKAEETSVDFPKPGAVTSWGSGCFISPKRILTAFHVVNEGRLFIEFGGAWHACKLVKHDKALDLALLEVRGVESAQIIELASAETLTAIGSDKSKAVTEKAVLRSGGVALGTVTDGNSGGPVLDKSGKLIGMITSNIMPGEMKELTGGHPAVIYVGAETIREFLKK